MIYYAITSDHIENEFTVERELLIAGDVRDKFMLVKPTHNSDNRQK